MATTGAFTPGGKGPMALTLVIATGLHWLLLVALPQPDAPINEFNKTVRVSLDSSRQPSLTSPAIPVNRPEKAVNTPQDSALEIVREIPRERAQEETQESARKPDPVPASEKALLSEASDHSTPESALPAPANEEQRPDIGSQAASLPEESLAQNSSQAGSQGEGKEKQPGNSEHRQESTDPQRPQLSPYELAIRRAIAREIRYTPSMSELDSPRRVTLKIELMDNGILQRASVTESSGDNRLDYQARQAALVASPFPAIPEEQRERRFELELKFTPGS